MKSLELNWIRNFDKSLFIPEVVFHSLNSASGKYYPPEKKGWLYDENGHPYLMRFGVIVINPNQSDKEVPRTIAHEWKHHWQYFHGIKFEIPPTNLFNRYSYMTAIVKYFKCSRTESDAIRFEYKHAGMNEYWKEALYNFIK